MGSGRPPPPIQVRVLVVDDDAGMRAVVRAGIQFAGMTVVGEAGDGESAIALAREYQPDVVVLDVAMPGMDGVTAIPLILDAAPDTRIVMLSANEHRRRDSLEAGAHAWVSKGSSWGEVHRTISEVLRGR
jgi:DNA-binding NarL/FixJ family response regulator